MLVSLCLLTGCSSNEDQEELKKKTSSQISYIESTLSKLTNGVLLLEYNASDDEKLQKKENNNGENAESGNSSQNSSQSSGKTMDSKNQSEDQGTKDNNTSGDVEQENSSANVSLDWDKVNDKLEDVYSSWSVLAIDLNKLNIDNSEILGFGKVVDDVKISIQAKNEPGLLVALTNLYSYIPKYISSYTEDSFEVAKKNMKYYIISTGTLVKNDNWEEATKQIEVAEGEYVKLMNNVNYASNNSYNMNKIYILLEETKNSMQYNNKDIFFLKYKALIEELN